MLKQLASLYSDWKTEHSARTEAAQFGARTDGDDGKGDDGPTAGEDADGTSPAPSDGASGEGPGAPTEWQDLLDGEEVSKQEVQVELGLQPHEFLAWLVRDAGGRMWQADLVETTGWSKSTVSRYLDTLESDDVVERVRIGRRKLVGVPDQMPTGVQGPDGPTENASVDLGSWADEAV